MISLQNRFALVPIMRWRSIWRRANSACRREDRAGAGVRHLEKSSISKDRLKLR